MGTGRRAPGGIVPDVLPLLPAAGGRDELRAGAEPWVKLPVQIYLNSTGRVSGLM
jgi:hypothetical protein